MNPLKVFNITNYIQWFTNKESLVEWSKTPDDFELVPDELKYKSTWRKIREALNIKHYLP